MNALLRRVSRERKQLPLPSQPPIDFLSIALSHPRWLAERWLGRHGFDAAVAWARFDNSAAALTLRANTLRITRDALARDLAVASVETRDTRFAPHGLIVTSGNPLLTPLAHAGLFFVQDEASQLGRRVRRRRARRADPRRLRVARRQDHADGGGCGRPRDDRRR